MEVVKNYIIIHHSATRLDVVKDQIRSDHEGKRWGYNLMIKPDGGIWWGESMRIKNAHTVADKPNYSHISFNTEGIGICLIGDFTRGFPSDEQINQTAYIIDRLQMRFGIMDHNIFGHNRVSYTECPGFGTMELVRRRIGH